MQFLVTGLFLTVFIAVVQVGILGRAIAFFDAPQANEDLRDKVSEPDHRYHSASNELAANKPHNAASTSAPAAVSPSVQSVGSAISSEATARAAPSLDELCTLLVSAAEQNSLPLNFFVNLIWQESRFARTAVSRAGALGVAQFMPFVA